MLVHRQQAFVGSQWQCWLLHYLQPVFSDRFLISFLLFQHFVVSWYNLAHGCNTWNSFRNWFWVYNCIDIASCSTVCLCATCFFFQRFITSNNVLRELCNFSFKFLDSACRVSFLSFQVRLLSLDSCNFSLISSTCFELLLLSCQITNLTILSSNLFISCFSVDSCQYRRLWH